MREEANATTGRAGAIKVLHLVTRPEDSLAAQVIDTQRASGDLEVRVIDLAGEEVDYESVLTAVFEADSVAVW